MCAIRAKAGMQLLDHRWANNRSQYVQKVVIVAHVTWTDESDLACENTAFLRAAEAAPAPGVLTLTGMISGIWSSRPGLQDHRLRGSVEATIADEPWR